MVIEIAQTEEEFLRTYDPRAYAPVAVTVDLTIFTIRNSKLSILLIKRGGHPEKGKWALPGGFVNVDESLEQAAARELEEETSLSVEEGFLEQLRTYGYPGRDPRGYVVSTAYVALAPRIEPPTAGDDASEAHFFPVEDVLSEDFALAFDHGIIVRDGLERVRSKLEYAPIAHHFLDDDEFTLTELRRVYELVWGTEVVASNFRRKVQAVPGLVEAVGLRRTSEVEGGRSSDLFRAGPAREIYPPLRRPEATSAETVKG